MGDGTPPVLKIRVLLVLEKIMMLLPKEMGPSVRNI
jgi:hypothetical protein